MYDFDGRLSALAGCPVIEGKGGAMVFNPYPVIIAEKDPILAHEICHVLGGREDYEIFATATEVRNDKIFNYILNMLYDWYHEYLHGKYSGFLWGKLTELHKTFVYEPTGLKDLDFINKMYCDRNVSPKSVKIRDVIDLVAYADRMYESIVKDAKILGITIAELEILIGEKGTVLIRGCGKGEFETEKDGKGRSKKGKAKGKMGKLGGPKSDINTIPKKSNYYISAVSRYFEIINELATLWKRNKYEWINNYYGEINWRNLPGMLLGSEISLPIWRLFSKIGLSRKIYLVIDRSGSTHGIKELIMDTAIIIADSLRMLNIPISILDVGVTHNVVNQIDEKPDLSWFTPMADDGTPLGEVCSLITDANHDSYLLIVTDGLPNDWEKLVSAVERFPGSALTFVIGEAYGEYIKKIKNVVHVEPHTIIREMLHDSTLS